MLDKKKHRIAALAFVFVVIIASAAYAQNGRSAGMYLDEGNWTCTIEDESIVRVDIAEGNHITVTAKHDGTTYIYFKNTDGTIQEYYVTVSRGDIMINNIDND